MTELLPVERLELQSTVQLVLQDMALVVLQGMVPVVLQGMVLVVLQGMVLAVHDVVRVPLGMVLVRQDRHLGIQGTPGRPQVGMGEEGSYRGTPLRCANGRRVVCSGVCSHPKRRSCAMQTCCGLGLNACYQRVHS